MSKKPRKAVESPMSLGEVEPGDTAILESGAVCEVGFRLGSSTFVRFSDNNEPRCISGLPSSTAVASVNRRARVATASGEVDDPLAGGGRK